MNGCEFNLLIDSSSQGCISQAPPLTVNDRETDLTFQAALSGIAITGTQNLPTVANGPVFPQVL